MTTEKHGISIGIERVDNELIMIFKATGKLTHEDYQVITPMLESALSGFKSPHVKVLLDARYLTGWDLHAAWDDFKLGMKYRGDFTQVAIVGNKDWQDLAAKVGSWFVSGEVRKFANMEAAYKWLQES